VVFLALSVISLEDSLFQPRAYFLARAAFSPSFGQFFIRERAKKFAKILKKPPRKRLDGTRDKNSKRGKNGVFHHFYSHGKGAPRYFM